MTRQTCNPLEAPHVTQSKTQALIGFCEALLETILLIFQYLTHSVVPTLLAFLCFNMHLKAFALSFPHVSDNQYSCISTTV